MQTRCRIGTRIAQVTPSFYLFRALGPFGRNLIRERICAGLAAAARDRKNGRKPLINTKKLARARSVIGKSVIGKRLTVRVPQSD
jgi:DNA invertase Pin-like site-specific DNA recombinase